MLKLYYDRFRETYHNIFKSLIFSFILFSFSSPFFLHNYTFFLKQSCYLLVSRCHRRSVRRSVRCVVRYVVRRSVCCVVRYVVHTLFARRPVAVHAPSASHSLVVRAPFACHPLASARRVCNVTPTLWCRDPLRLHLCAKWPPHLPMPTTTLRQLSPINFFFNFSKKYV